MALSILSVRMHRFGRALPPGKGRVGTIRRRLVGLIVAAVLVSPTTADGQTVSTPHCLAGCPAGTASLNDLIVREAYTLSSSPLSKFADWVAFRVAADGIASGRDRRWRADPWLAEDRTLEPDDYAGAHAALGTDRGHQAPLASLGGMAQWRTTNFLSNITPQRSALNQGPWRMLEAAIRDLVTGDRPAHAEAFVLTGPLYERPMPPLPGADEPHRLPSGYWKVIAVADGVAVHALGFIFDQEAGRQDNYCDGRVDLFEIEVRTRLLLFPRLAPPDRPNAAGAARLADELGCVEAMVERGTD